MASQRYIELLADAATRAAVPIQATTADLWKEFDSSWEYLAEGNYDHAPALTYFATVSLALLSSLTGTPVPHLAARATELHVGKNAGYAGGHKDPWANFRMATSFGVTPFDGVMVRLSDKYIRTQNLRRNPANEQVGESIADTLFDASAYALIARCIQEESHA